MTSEDIPLADFVVSLGAGILYLILALSLSLPEILALFGFLEKTHSTPASILILVYFGLANIFYGCILIVLSLLLYRQPYNHHKWGFLILVFSILSFFIPRWAWLWSGIGFILGILGGVLGIIWKPEDLESDGD